MAALCSANRSERRAVAAKFLATHRCRQPVSRPDRALEVKSSTQGTKQPSTILLNICVAEVRVSEGVLQEKGGRDDVGRENGGRGGRGGVEKGKGLGKEGGRRR